MSWMDSYTMCHFVSDFLHWAQCSWGSSMLLHVFWLLNHIPSHVPHLVHVFVGWWTSWLLPFLAVVLPSLYRKSCILEKSYGLGIDIISGVWLAQAGAFWLIHSLKPLSIYSFFVPSTGLSPGSPAVSKMHMAHAFMGLSCRQAVSEQIKAGEY